MLSRRINGPLKYRCRCRKCLSFFIAVTLLTGKRFHLILWQLFAGLAATLILPALTCPAKSSANNPHHFQQACENCHQLLAGADDSKHRKIGPLHRDINRACGQAGCHEHGPTLSHPVGVRAGGYVPPGMPLDSKGRITCLTCHDELNGPNSNQLPAFLRHAPGRDFCALCHQASGDTARKRSHWQFTTKAHLEFGKSQVYFENNAEYTSDIDLESYTCLSCHDDISAVVLIDNEKGLGEIRQRKDMSDHPIGMTYAIRVSRNNNDFNMPVTLDKRIRFFNGRLGCGSCHNLYNSEKNNLVLPFVNGALCRQCHIR